MLGHMQSFDNTPICIARHTIQFIWNISSQENTMGLLGSTDGITIDSATLITLCQPQKIAVIAEQWAKENLALCGVFHCTPFHAENMQQYENQLKTQFHLCTKIPFIHLNIIFNTKGCLESEAWVLKQGKAVQIPLLLLEDGQPQQMS